MGQNSLSPTPHSATRLPRESLLGARPARRLSGPRGGRQRPLVAAMGMGRAGRQQLASGTAPSLSGGGAGAGRVLGQDAELVSLRIGERDPATAIGPAVISEVRGSQREDPLHLLFAGAIGRAQVKVHPVLDLLTV